MSRFRRKIKVFVAMSGGVDSSVAALLLKKKGYDVVGVYMKGWSLTDCAAKDAEDARRVAGVLNIPFYVFDFEDEYKKSVVDYMISGYASGITPNPDVMCNREIKFGLFLKKALKLGADFIATGHYVQLTHNKQHITHNKNKNVTLPSKNFSLGKFLVQFVACNTNNINKVFIVNLTGDRIHQKMISQRNHFL